MPGLSSHSTFSVIASTTASTSPRPNASSIDCTIVTLSPPTSRLLASGSTRLIPRRHVATSPRRHVATSPRRRRRAPGDGGKPEAVDDGLVVVLPATAASFRGATSPIRWCDQVVVDLVHRHVGL